jgi:hypothetical protein
VFDQYVQFPNDQAPRREVLDTVADATFERLVAGNLPAPRHLAQLYAPLVGQGHFDVVVFDDAAAPFFEKTGLDGRFVAPPGDSLAVTSLNSVGNKIDTFLTRTVTYRARVHDHQVDGTLSVELTNDAPRSGLPFYVIGSSTTPPLPKGTNRTSLLVYTQARPHAVRVDGHALAVPMVVAEDRWLTEVPVTLGAGATARVEVDVAGEVAFGPSGYTLQLEPGGGPQPDDYQVDVAVDGQGTARHRGPVDAVRSVTASRR